MLFDQLLKAAARKILQNFVKSAYREQVAEPRQVELALKGLHPLPKIRNHSATIRLFYPGQLCAYAGMTRGRCNQVLTRPISCPLFPLLHCRIFGGSGCKFMKADVGSAYVFCAKYQTHHAM
jgi:hypothetical protein